MTLFSLQVSVIRNSSAGPFSSPRPLYTGVPQSSVLVLLFCLDSLSCNLIQSLDQLTPQIFISSPALSLSTRLISHSLCDISIQMSMDILNSILLGTELLVFSGGPQAYPSQLMAPPSFQLHKSQISEPFLTSLFLSYNIFIRNSSWLKTDLESNHFSSPPLSLSRYKLTSLLNYCKSLIGIPTSTLPAPAPRLLLSTQQPK